MYGLRQYFVVLNSMNIVVRKCPYIYLDTHTPHTPILCLFLHPTISFHIETSSLLTHGDDVGWFHCIAHIVSGGSWWCCGGVAQKHGKHWSCRVGTCERHCDVGSGWGCGGWWLVCADSILFVCLSHNTRITHIWHNTQHTQHTHMTRYTAMFLSFSFLPHSFHKQASYPLTHGDDAEWLHFLVCSVSWRSCWCCGSAAQEQGQHRSCTQGTCERQCVVGSGCGSGGWWLVCADDVCEYVIVWYACVELLDEYMNWHMDE